MTLGGFDSTQIRFLPELKGKCGAEFFSCPEMRTGEAWSYGADYYGVCACIHTLLYGIDLDICEERGSDALKRGFVYESFIESGNSTNDINQISNIRVPKVSLKRYWQRAVWSEVYMVLLNAKVSREAPTDFNGLLTGLKKIIDSVPQVESKVSKYNIYISVIFIS